jgi:hypothetical protein
MTTAMITATIGLTSLLIGAPGQPREEMSSADCAVARQGE